MLGRRRIAHDKLNAIPGIVCPEPKGAFYVFPSVEGLLGREVAGRVIDSSLTFCEVMLEQAKVALVPGEGFGAPGYVRISYALSDADLTDGLDRLAATLA